MPTSYACTSTLTSLLYQFVCPHVLAPKQPLRHQQVQEHQQPPLAERREICPSTANQRLSKASSSTHTGAPTRPPYGSCHAGATHVLPGLGARPCLGKPSH